MQRSRRALLLRRRVSEDASKGRNRLYKVSLSLVFLVWGLLLLSTLWISHGNGHKGNSLAGSVQNGDQDDVSADDTYEHVDAPSLESTSVHIPAAEEIKDTVDGNVTESKEDITLVKQSEMVNNNTGPENDTETSTSKFHQVSRAVPLGFDEFKSRVPNSKDESGPVRFVNWMRIPDAASARSNWMQQSDVVRSRFWKFWIMRLKIVSGCSYVRFTFLYFVSG
ncbi:PREDICTED: uncharacterized protein LOC106297942 [Brassica oleracea var. oleracea]|uniref:uncharacterized protein LOC106297942 n=1 Tax=Brassica oleracea var. oleracea TaxID=109376 RepID=UPI0006A753A8|nr:PREDICTED: uncharacterized protein LOC106297942 [Brassica oleracea var. oleracea]